MSSTKRTSGDYDIYAGANVAGTYSGTVRIHGNLDVVGTQTFIESVDTLVKDRFMTVNSGELGAGITRGSPPSAGIEVDRGSSPKVYIRYNEASSKWEITNDGSTYLPIAYGSLSVAGANGDIQYNDAGSGFGADSAFNFNSITKTLTLSNISLQGSTISTVATNQDLTLDPNGVGRIVVNGAVKLADQGSNPVASASNNYVYSKTPSTGGSGVFFVNTTASDELISKTKAQIYALIL
jgi:hypothetical protein